MRAHSQHLPPSALSPARELSDDESLVELRCAVIVSRGNEVLLLRRDPSERSRAKGHGPARAREEWVLPGGRPKPNEGMLACARREVAEETGLSVMPHRCAFVADVIAPDAEQRCVELVFTASVAATCDTPLVGEPGVEPMWVPVGEVRRLRLRPPIAGFLPGVVAGTAPTAPYLGNLWRPEDESGEQP